MQGRGWANGLSITNNIICFPPIAHKYLLKVTYNRPLTVTAPVPKPIAVLGSPSLINETSNIEPKFNYLFYHINTFVTGAGILSRVGKGILPSPLEIAVPLSSPPFHVGTTMPPTILGKCKDMVGWAWFVVIIVQARWPSIEFQHRMYVGGITYSE